MYSLDPPAVLEQEASWCKGCGKCKHMYTKIKVQSLQVIVGIIYFVEVEL